jgi:predicted transposase YdaD
MANGETVTLEAEKKLYNSSLKKEDKSDLLTAMTIFAGLKDKSLCATLIKRRRDIMIESYGYRLIKEEGFAEGIIEGEIKGEIKGEIRGKIEGLRDGILLALDFRYGEEAKNLAHTIKQIDSLDILTDIYHALREKNGLECIEKMVKME